jgi:hypothetical protein
VADVIREFEGGYEERYGLSGEERRVLRDLTRCRTATLGGHKRICDRCGHEEISYNSCRNRHCPKCQARARAKWLDDRADDLLEVPYFHVVFTLPNAFGPLALQNRRRVYGILFRAVAVTLLTIGRDPKHLGAEIGFLAVLHTWSQKLQHHPHVHCVVPGGGLAPDGDQWIACRSKRFFLPVRVLSRLFRGKFLAYLRKAYRQEKLSLRGKLADLQDPATWSLWLEGLATQEWVVYAKPPFGGPTQALKYLARYTHRVAIANSRLVALGDGKVTFRWKDYARGNRQRLMTLDGTEFLRRFLLHILPSGFQRIRHYGFLGNRVRAKKLARAKSLLDEEENRKASAEEEPRDDTKEDPWLCPVCQAGHLVRSETLSAYPARERAPPDLAA